MSASSPLSQDFMLTEKHPHQIHPHLQDARRIKGSHLTSSSLNAPAAPEERSGCTRAVPPAQGTEGPWGWPWGWPREAARRGTPWPSSAAGQRKGKRGGCSLPGWHLGRMWVRFQLTALPGRAEANIKFMAVAVGEAGPYSLSLNISCSFPFNEN